MSATPNRPDTLQFSNYDIVFCTDAFDGDVEISMKSYSGYDDVTKYLDMPMAEKLYEWLGKHLAYVRTLPDDQTK